MTLSSAAVLVLLAAAAHAVAAPPSSPSPPSWTVSADLQVTALVPGVWMHTSWHTWNGTRIPSNGLVVRDGTGVLLVDTAWGEAPTDALVDWVERELRLRVTRAVVTHAHDDRLGGGAALARRKIPFLGHAGTVAAASVRRVLAPATLGPMAPGASARMGPVDVFFPGAAHTPDNVVVWVRGSRILFGGCAV